MVKWSIIAGAVQMGTFLILRKMAIRIEQGNVASAIFVATMSVAFGILNAVAISY